MKRIKQQRRMRAGLIRLCLMTAFLILLQTAALCGGTAASAEDSKAAGHTEKELAVDLTGTGDGYSAVLYDNSNGLPTSEANAIAETEEGFIWIGSYSGLIRYDGNTFERMDSTSGLASVLSLFVDSRNRLWVGTNDSGAAVMENGTFTMLRKADGLTSLSVRSITEDPAGTIYLGTTAGLALVDADMHLEMMQDPQIRDEYIRMLRICGDTVYGVTKNGAVFAVRDRELLWFYDSSKTRISDIHAILPDPENPDCAYVGSQGSDLYYVRFSGNVPMLKRIDISPCNYINDIALAGDLIWLCTDTGIGFLTDDNFVYIRNIPMNTAIEGMMSDYQRNLWFVSSQQGVMKIVPDQFTDVFDRCRLSPEVVYSTCMYGDKLLVGTKNTGLLVLEDGSTADCLPVTESRSASGKVFGDTNLVETLKDSKIRSIIRDSQNRLWFSTFGEEGLLRYDNGALLRFTEADGMPSERVRAVYECVDGRFLAACTGGVAVIEGDRVVAVHGESDKIANTEILTVTEGVDGAYILGTDGGGIYVINGRKVSHYGTDDGLLSDVVMRIKKDVKRDLYWIVTSNSLAYMTADYQITTVTNFPYSNNFDLYENSRNEMWVLSSNGIYVADTDQLLQNEEISYLFYNGDNGMPCISTSNSYSELTENGDLYIAGTTGIAKVNIEIPFENVNELKLAVPFLEADGKPLYPDTNGKFTVPASTKKVTIYSYVYNYSLINPQVTYRLIGFDTKPVTVLRSDLSAQDYTNLHGGTYRFYLEIQDPHGMSKKELTVTIEKQKHLYEMFWVRFLMILAGAAILAVLIRLYIRRRTEAAEKRNEQQKQLTREIVEAFSKVIDMKDRYTNGHSARVAEYTVMLSREMGLDEETIEQYYCIALLHDIGKIGVPAEVLNKNGKLTDDEFRVIKSHSELGSNALKDISIMPELSIGAGAHHERPDGKGYPNGLTEEEIPLVAKIIAVADTFDAMYSDRPYRKRMNFDKAVSIIKGSSGTQLSSEVVDAFLRLVEQGRMRAADDTGGGTTEDIDNIRKAGAEP